MRDCKSGKRWIPPCATRFFIIFHLIGEEIPINGNGMRIKSILRAILNFSAWIKTENGWIICNFALVIRHCAQSLQNGFQSGLREPEKIFIRSVQWIGQEFSVAVRNAGNWKSSTTVLPDRCWII